MSILSRVIEALRDALSTSEPVPVPVPAPNAFDEWPPLLLLTGLVWGEARGEPWEAKLGVAWVVRNRVQRGGWFGDGWIAVMTKRFQFSCFLANDPNSRKIRNPLKHEPLSVWNECHQAALRAYRGMGQDPTGGATYFIGTSIIPPPWTKKLTLTRTIGHFLFYR